MTEDEIYLRDLTRLVKAVAEKYPQIPVIEGPGYVMLGKPEPKPSRWRIPEHIVLGMIGGLMSSSSLLALIYFNMPGLFGLINQ